MAQKSTESAVFMSLKVAFQMDPMEVIKPATDSSFIAMLEAQRRGYEVFHYLPTSLALEDNVLRANLRPVEVSEEPQNYYRLGDPVMTDLSEMDVIFLRQDPPFDMGYITTTYLLEKIKDQVLIVNDPSSVRDCPEKIFVTQFADLMPPTLISGEAEAIEVFRKKHGDVVLKPLYGNASANIVHLKTVDQNLAEALDMFNSIYPREPVIAQKFLPQVRQGDKRIILFDGEPVGAINRVPPPNDIRAALALGGKAEKTELNARDREICLRLKPELQKRGLFFAGIDVIDGYLTEINITSPTGIPVLNKLNCVRLEVVLWDMLEKKL